MLSESDASSPEAPLRTTTLMLAVRFDGSIQVDRDFPTPPPQAGEALVRVTRAGICDTDIQITRGYMNFTGVMGHELVGVVEKASQRRWVGKRVTSEINCSCGKCELCQGGLSRHCPTRSVIGIQDHDGAFAEYVVVPERNLHELPDAVSEDEGVFVEPLAAALQITNQARIEARSKALVLGDGKLGNLVAQVLNTTGCELMSVGKHPERLAILEKLGIRAELLEQVRPRRQWDIVVDCTGSARGLADAMRFVRPRGTIVMKTTVAESGPVNLAPLVVDEITLLGSRCGPFPAAIEMLASHKVEVIPLIDEIYRLADAETALARAGSGEVMKVLLAVDESIPSVKKLKDPRR